MATTLASKVIELSLKMHVDDSEINKSTKDIENKFNNVKPAIERATKMLTQFSETVRKMESPKGPDKLTAKLYKTQQVAAKTAEEIMKLWSKANQPIDGKYTSIDMNRLAQQYEAEFGTIDELEAKVKSLNQDLAQAQTEAKGYLQSFNTYSNNLYKDIVQTNSEIMRTSKQLKHTDVSSEQYQTLSSRLSVLKSHLSEVRAEYNNLDKSVQQQRVEESGNKIESLRAKYDELSEALRHYRTALKGENYTEALGSLTAIESLDSKMQDLEHTIKAITASYSSASASSNRYYRYAIYHAIRQNGLFRTFKQTLKDIANIFKKLTSLAKQLFTHTHKAFNSNSNGLKTALKNIMRYGLGVRSLYFLFRRLRNVAKDAFAEMAKQWDPVNQQISSMIQSLNGVKGSIATMLQPLLAGFATFFNQLMSILQKVMETIGAFFAFLTGQNYILRAKAGGVDWAQSLADNLGAANDEAEELNKQLAGFDKLNNLTTNKDKDKGGKTDIGLGTVGFEKVPIEQLDLFNWLKDMWLKTDFSDLGRELNSKLLNALKKLDWNKIEYYGRKIGTCLATAINGFFEDRELARELGKAIAGSLNTAFGALYEFATRVEWDKIGLFIVDGIKSFFSHAKFKEWGAAAESLIGGLIESIYVVVSDKEMWNKATTKIIDGINGFLTQGLKKKRVLTGFDSNHVPIYEELNDFQMAGKGLSNFAKNLLTSMTSILENEENREAFRKAVKSFMEGVDWSGIVFVLKDFGKALLESAKLAIQDAYSADPDFFNFTIKAVLTVTIVRCVLSILSSAASAITQAAIASKIAQAITGGSSGGVSAVLATTGGEFALAITATAALYLTLKYIQTKIDDAFRQNVSDDVQEKVDEFDNLINTSITKKGTVSPVTAGGAGGAGQVMGIKLAFTVLSKFFKTKSEEESEAKATGEGIGEAVGNGVDEGIKSTIPSGNTITEYITQDVGNNSALSSKFTTLGEDAGTGYNKGLKSKDIPGETGKIMKDAISEVQTVNDSHSPSRVYEGLGKDAIDGYLLPFKNFVKLHTQIWTTVRDSAIDAVKGMYSGLSTVANSILNVMTYMANGITNIFDNIISNIVTAVNMIASSIGNVLTSITESFNNLSNINLDNILNGKVTNVVTKVPKVKIPHLATGAVIPPNKQFLAMLGDQNSGTNVEAPLSTIEDAVRNVMSEMNFTFNFDVSGDPEKIFKVVRKQSDQFIKRTGHSWT